MTAAFFCSVTTARGDDSVPDRESEREREAGMTKEVDGPESSVSSGQHARPLALSAPTSCVHEKRMLFSPETRPVPSTARLISTTAEAGRQGAGALDSSVEKAGGPWGKPARRLSVARRRRWSWSGGPAG